MSRIISKRGKGKVKHPRGNEGYLGRCVSKIHLGWVFFGWIRRPNAGPKAKRLPKRKPDRTI